MDVKSAEPPRQGSSHVDAVLMPFTTAQIGGSHISGMVLAEGLARRFGCRIVVVAPAGAQVLDMARDMGFEAIESGDKPRWRHRPDRDLLRTPARIRVIKDIRSRVLVHCNDLGALQAWALAARMQRAPLVYHNRAFDRDIWPNRTLIRLSDRVISVSEACDRSLPYLAARKRSVLIDPFLTPLSVEATETRKGLLAELGAAPDSRLVGFVGNLWSRKRPEMFVEIAQELAQREPRAKFVVFGRDGDISVDEISRQARVAGLEDRFLMAGFRLPPEENIAALDLLLMPALAEPFGRTPVEALLLGVPYVAADDAGHSEIYSRWKGGLVLRPEASALDYAEACKRVLEDPGSVRLSPERRRTILEELSPERHADDVMAVYGTILPD